MGSATNAAAAAETAGQAISGIEQAASEAGSSVGTGMSYQPQAVNASLGFGGQTPVAAPATGLDQVGTGGYHIMPESSYNLTPGTPSGWADTALGKIYTGTKNDFSGLMSDISKGNYLGATGYMVNKLGDTLMNMRGGQSTQAPISYPSASQPHPDNSYLQRLRRISRGY